MNVARNWALWEAHKRIALLEAARGAEIKIDFKARCVMKGDDILFSQKPAELKRTFHGIVASLSLE